MMKLPPPPLQLELPTPLRVSCPHHSHHRARCRYERLYILGVDLYSNMHFFSAGVSSAYATIEASTKRLHDYGHKGPETLRGRHGTAERMVRFLPAFLANHKLPTFNLSPDSLLNGSTGIPLPGKPGHGWIQSLNLSEAVRSERGVAAMTAAPTGGFSAAKACGLAPALHPAWVQPPWCW